MEELTLKSSPINLKIVEKPSVIPVLYKIMKELIIPKRNFMNIRDMGELLWTSKAAH